MEGTIHTDVYIGCIHTGEGNNLLHGRLLIWCKCYHYRDYKNNIVTLFNVNKSNSSNRRARKNVNVNVRKGLLRELYVYKMFVNFIFETINGVTQFKDMILVESVIFTNCFHKESVLLMSIVQTPNVKSMSVSSVVVVYVTSVA